LNSRDRISLPVIGFEFESDVPCSTPAWRHVPGKARHHTDPRSSIQHNACTLLTWLLWQRQQ